MRERNICNSGTSAPVNPLLIVLNGRHLKINVHHFVWTTGGRHDDQACFRVKGGQLSLSQLERREGAMDGYRGSRGGGGMDREREGRRDEEMVDEGGMDTGRKE